MFWGFRSATARYLPCVTARVGAQALQWLLLAHLVKGDAELPEHPEISSQDDTQGSTSVPATARVAGHFSPLSKSHVKPARRGELGVVCATALPSLDTLKHAPLPISER